MTRARRFECEGEFGQEKPEQRIGEFEAEIPVRDDLGYPRGFGHGLAGNLFLEPEDIADIQTFALAPFEIQMVGMPADVIFLHVFEEGEPGGGRGVDVDFLDKAETIEAGDFEHDPLHTVLYGIDDSAFHVHTVLYGDGMAEHLRKEDWTDAGLAALEREGFTAVKADKLARALKVSRGSFYWHFKDIAAFEQALIDRWRDLLMAALDAPLADVPPRERLRIILTQSMTSTRRVEIAMRGWATVRPDLKAQLDVIDARRIGYMQGLVTECGVAEGRAKPVARVLYWTYLGHALSAHLDADEVPSLVDQLLSLLER